MLWVGCRGSDALVSPRERALAGRLDAINAEFCERVRPLSPSPLSPCSVRRRGLSPLARAGTRLCFVCKLILGCGCVQLESLQSKTDEKVDAILELIKHKAA